MHSGQALVVGDQAICVIAEDIDRLKQETDAFLKTLPAGGTCFITHANNLGASVVSG